MKRIFTTRIIAISSILIGLDVILTGPLAINTQFLRISINFLTHTLLGAILGPIGAPIAFGISDVLGATIFPSGPFFWGFTLSAMLLGVLYGIFYYKKEITWKRVALATTVITLLESLIFTPIWLTLMYKVPFWGLMPIRFGKALILIPIQIIVVHFVLKRLQATPVFKKLTKDSD